MILEAVKSYNGPCTNSQIREYINKKWPGQNPGSINDHINAASVNLPGRINYPENKKEVDTPRNKYDFLFWRARGNVELYDPDPSKHGKWGIASYNGKFRIYRDIKPVPEHRNQEKYSIIYHTDKRWLENIRKSSPEIINFWSRRKDGLSGIYPSMPFFFKTSDQVITGYASLLSQDTMTAGEAWAKFGWGNGSENEEEFLQMLSGHGKPSDRDTRITCFILRDPVFFQNPPKLADCGIIELQTMKYLDEWETSIITGMVEEFSPLTKNQPAAVKGNVHSLSVTDGRPYQIELRRKLMDIYGNKCAICDMDIPEILRASHIIPHSINDETAKRLDNAILLCSLHDSLFDRGFITIIDDNGKYTVKVSRELTKSKSNAAIQIWSYLKGAQFHVPTKHPPSETSLKYHNSNIFLG
jgi:hypothetical protein